MSGSSRRYIDIGANLLDGMFRGRYHGKRAHADDLPVLFDRAAEAGLSDIMVTCSNLKDARRAIDWARKHNASPDSRIKLTCTVGVHPTNTMQLEASATPHHPHHPAATESAPASTADPGCGCGAPTSGGHAVDATSESDDHEGPTRSKTAPALNTAQYIAALDALLAADKVSSHKTVVAIGECGLDYDRLFFSPKEVQLRHFGFHFDLAEKYNLPMFFHDRNTGGDFADIVRKQRHRFPTGVVHSFTGTQAELDTYLDMGLYIGINGCSLKTEDNLNVAKRVPLDRVMLETDAPWCDIKKSHASHSYVKTAFPTAKKEKYTAGKLVQGRCEPCQIVQVAEALAGIMGIDIDTLTTAAYENTRKVFFPSV
jgi:TatD DNase family protein